MNYKKYFKDLGLTEIAFAPNEDCKVNDMQQDQPYLPDLRDLYNLHRIIIDTKRTTILEFGCGWSTVVMAHALEQNKCDISHLRRNNPFELHSVDNEKKWIQRTKKRVKAHFHYSPAKMTMWNGMICTEYETLPLINPDFIYLDAPEQFNVKGNINGITTNHKDMMPMSCDILKLENFLTPGTIIVIDGRTANARFLERNLQRNWKYSFKDDQHTFLLDEPPLGEHNAKQLKFYQMATPEELGV